jgi:hypothetical protein
MRSDAPNTIRATPSKGGHMAKPNAKAPLGQGGRFAAMKAKLAQRGAHDPGALAAYIGRKKYGNARFAKLSAGGKK